MNRLPQQNGFSGSYSIDDVHFLLEPIDIEPTPVAEKERLIQSGQRHYSEMISREAIPSQEYLQLFHAAVDRNQQRFAEDLWKLAGIIEQTRVGESIAIVSLARAGTPVGVLVGRALRQQGLDCRHFSISIIRDRGIDPQALKWIRNQFCDQSIRFLDGWTGKGVIARELEASIGRYNRQHDCQLPSKLFAVADLCGCAQAAATNDDYLIPSAILGATISGLISRSILNAQVISAGSFHGCLYLEDFAEFDLSTWFVERIWQTMQSLPPAQVEMTIKPPEPLIANRWLQSLMQMYAISNPHYVKPGICEATRVLLRRVPGRLIVRSCDDPEVEHLLLLANQKCVPISVQPELPLRAVALIQDLDKN